MSAARRAARAKPVMVLKAGPARRGREGRAVAYGALAGSDAVYDAAFRRAGLLRVLDLDELFEAAEMLSFTPRLEGERLAILTNGGGAGVLAADRLADLDGRLADISPATTKAALTRRCRRPGRKGNPVDIIGDAGPERYEAALAGPARRAETSDAILVINCPTALASSASLRQGRAIAMATARKRCGKRVKPLLTNWLGDGAAAASRQRFRGGEAFRRSKRRTRRSTASCSSCATRERRMS